MATGTGLLPQPQDPVSVYTEAGSNTTLIIPFRNPMDHPVLVDVHLKGNVKRLRNLGRQALKCIVENIIIMLRP